MPPKHDEKPPRPDFKIDHDLTADLRFKRENGLFPAPPFPKKALTALVILLIAFSAIGLPLLIGAPFALIGIFIILNHQAHHEGDSIKATCPSCAMKMRKEKRNHVEHFLCNRCKIYAIGRDFNG